MRALHLLVAGAIAVFAVIAGLFAAVLVIGSGAVAYLVQWFRGRTTPSVRPKGRSPAPRRSYAGGDVIEVEATPVPAEPPPR